MEIRDISKYLKSRYDVSINFSKLGTSEEPLLTKLFGEEPNIDAIIGSNSSFAQNAQEQLFYEFAQNAFDAEAEYLYFFANEKYLIVLNNGKPFYTDTEGEIKREGQLFNFLGKGKSQKYDDPEKMGKYGQGSKLLYNLLCDNHPAKPIESLLIEAIKEKKLGPYLLSWANRTQLDNITSGLHNKWEYIDPNNEREAALICKIVMGYYPIMPGENDYFLSNDEMEEVFDAFNELVNPKRLINRINHGTALIIPLGQSQYERITNEDNIQRVISGLNGFASLHGSSKQIEIFGRVVEPANVITINVETSIDNFASHYKFAFNAEFTTKQYVSLYKWLPITTYKSCLGFLIDCRTFDIDDSRQRLQDKNNTQKQLQSAFTALTEKLSSVSKGFDIVYEAICASSIPDDSEYDFIREPFKSTILPFLEKNVRTQQGRYQPLENVYAKSNLGELSFINLAELGIKSRFWVFSEQTVEDYGRLGIEIQSPSPEEIVKQADENKIKEYVGGLSKEDYPKWHRYFINQCNNQDQELRELPLFKTNKAQIVSYCDIISDESAILFFDNNIISESHFLATDNEIEYVIEPLPQIDEGLGKILLNKINKNISTLRENDTKTDCVASILVALVNQNLIQKSQARKVALLKNERGNYCSFANLFNRDAGEQILSKFRAFSYIPNIIPVNWFINHDEIWNWIVANFDSIKELDDWCSSAECYINELIDFFPKNQNSYTPTDTVQLFLNEDGTPCDEDQHLIANITNEEDFNIIQEKFENESRKFVPFRFQKLLNHPAFGAKNYTCKINELIEDDQEFNEEQVKAFLRIDQNGILSSFWIEQDDCKYIFHKVQNPNNYIFGDPYAFEEEMRDQLLKDLYHEIPQKLHDSIVHRENYHISQKINNILERSQNIRYFFPIVETLDNEIKSKFLRKLKLNITDSIKSSSIEWRIIDFVIKNYRSFGDQFKRNLTINGQPLPESTRQLSLEIKGHDYNINELVPDVGQTSQVVESLNNLLPDAQRFISAFIESEKPWEHVEVLKLIGTKNLTIHQLEFCLDYFLNVDTTDQDNRDQLCLDNDSSLSDALEMIAKRKFKGFNKYWVYPDFKDKQVFADREVLLPEEILPEGLNNWLKENRENIELIDGLITDSNQLIAFRKALFNENIFIFPDKLESSPILDRSIDWILEYFKNDSILENSNQFSSIESFIDKLPQGTKTLLGLRYTGKTQLVENKSIPEFNICLLQNGIAFFNKQQVDLMASYLDKSQSFQNFISDNILFYPVSQDFYRRMKLDYPTWKINSQAQLSGEECEWSDKIYKDWKEKYKITILFTDKKVETLFSITSDGETLCNVQKSSGSVGSKEKEYIVIGLSNGSTDSILKSLKDFATNHGWFKNPFIEFQSMRIEFFEKLQRQAEINGTDLTQLVNQATHGSNQPANSDSHAVTVEVKDEQTAKCINEILSAYPPDLLTQLAENVDLISDALTNPNEPEAKVSQIIGYIGELIYKQYLDKLGIEYKFSADNNEGRYDFILYPDKPEEERLYVDVKTNLYSFKEGNYPFYIHRAQNNFLNEKPSRQLCIVRISLTDIGLKDRYKDLQTQFKTDTNPRTNEKLRTDCEKIATSYWEKAKQITFEQASPQYWLSIADVKPKSSTPAI